MKKSNFQMVLFAVIVFTACGPSSEEKSEIAYLQQNELMLADSASASPFKGKRKFMKSARLNFKVKDVRSSTFKIEHIAATHGGFVLLSEQTNNAENVRVTKISEDSTEHLSSGNIQALLQVRVPETELDSVLREIEKESIYLVLRRVEAEEANLQLLTEQLSYQRTNRSAERLKNIETHTPGKQKDVVVTEDRIVNKEELADNSLVQQMDIQDKISFSTINIELFQNPVLHRENQMNFKPSDEYVTPISTQSLESLKWGRDILVKLYLLIIKLWPFVIAALLIFFFGGKFKFRLRSSSES